MRRTSIKTDRQRLAILKSILARQDHDGEPVTLDRLSVADAERTMQDLKAAREAREAANSRKRNLMHRRDRLRTDLERCIRHFWTAVENRTQRLDHPPGILDLYQREPGQPRPKRPHPSEWLQIAEELAEGEARAVAQGFPAMVNPSIEEVQACLTEAETIHRAFQQADWDVQEASRNLKEERKKTDRVIRTIAFTLEEILYEWEDAAMRRIMRRYGFSFENRASDEIEILEEPEQQATA